MTTNSHEVWANSTTPLFLANPAQSITLSPTSGTGNVNLSNINGQLYQNGLPVGDAQLWSTYPATSNTIKMDASNTITNSGNNLYYNGNLIANASDIQNIGDWSLYNAVSDVNLSTPSSVVATGGTITTSGGYRFHTFTSSGTFTLASPLSLSVQVLIVGGGGAGGNNQGGGGGAGGATLSTITAYTGGTSIVVGAGGSVVSSGTYVGNNGGASSFGAVSVVGGGGGGAVSSPNGVDGGCGGGEGFQSGTTAGNGSVGFNGGLATGSVSGGWNTGGGGGMGSAGVNATSTTGGAGGAGQTFTIGGSSFLVAGGGGGQLYLNGASAGGAGGSGIGGTGGVTTTNSTNVNATNPVANTGSGGGGGNNSNGSASAGASGIVIVAYPLGSPLNYSISNAKNITAVSNVSAGTLTSSGNVSGTTGTFTTGVISPFHSNSGNLVLTSGSNLSLFATSNITSSAPTISNTFTNTYSILGDKGSDYTDFCYTTLSNKGGKGGQINLVADAGQVNIGGTNYGVGGLINITANSALVVPYNATSAIKLSAASILSYAGAVSPVGSLAGYNYIQGTLGVNIVAGSASSVPNTSGTIYLYGAAGTKIQNSLYVDTIINYPSGNLNIHPDSNQAVDMTRVQFIGMGSANNENLAYPVIRGSGNAVLYGFSSVNATTHTGVDYTGTTLNGFTTLTNSVGGDGGGFGDLSLTAYKTTSGIILPTYTYRNINLTSSSNINLNTSNGGQVLINGQPLAGSPSTWANYPATATINANSNLIQNCGGLDLTFGGVGHAVYGVSSLTMTAAGTLNMTGGTISNAGNLFGSNLTISTGGNLTLTSSTAPAGKIVAGCDLNMNNNAISNVGAFSRTLSATAVAQPVIQYGVGTGSGVSGTIAVTIPTAYTSSSSYVVQVTMRDAPAAQLYATPTASNAFTIGWTSAGTGTQNIMWTTFGT